MMYIVPLCSVNLLSHKEGNVTLLSAASARLCCAAAQVLAQCSVFKLCETRSACWASNVL
jgi:hypothetical protein